MSERVLQHLLQYLYTGACHFPQDDLNLGVDLVGVADQYMLEPMKLQCEKVLSSKIDKEVGVVEDGRGLQWTVYVVLGCDSTLLHCRPSQHTPTAG